MGVRPFLLPPLRRMAKKPGPRVCAHARLDVKTVSDSPRAPVTLALVLQLVRPLSLEHEPAETDAQPAHLPERRGGHQGAVPGDRAGVAQLEADPPLEARAANLPDFVWRRARAALGNAVKITQLHSWIDRPSHLASGLSASTTPP